MCKSSSLPTIRITTVIREVQLCETGVGVILELFFKT